jgi:hypothetical protein
MASAPKKAGRQNFKATPRHVTIDEFGKDHWSLLAYVETCIVDKKGAHGVPMVGEIDRDKIRCNGDRRSHLFGPRVAMANCKWKGEWGSRLQGYFEKKDASLQLPTHDDWDCLEDFEREGLAEIMSVVNGFIILTDKGMAICHHLREHKARGGHFAGFVYKPEMTLVIKEAVAA